jgi:hypothetical protein
MSRGSSGTTRPTQDPSGHHFILRLLRLFAANLGPDSFLIRAHPRNPWLKTIFFP